MLCLILVSSLDSTDVAYRYGRREREVKDWPKRQPDVVGVGGVERCFCRGPLTVSHKFHITMKNKSRIKWCPIKSYHSTPKHARDSNGCLH